MKIICIGRNYAAHAAEMKSSVPENPMIFMKPPTALLLKDKPMFIPEFTQNLHYEAEIVLKVAKNGRHVQDEFASEYYNQIAFGIDFTARDLQSQLKEKGHDNVTIIEVMGDKEDEHNEIISETRQMYEVEIQLMTSKTTKMRKEMFDEKEHNRASIEQRNGQIAEILSQI